MSRSRDRPLRRVRLFSVRVKSANGAFKHDVGEVLCLAMLPSGETGPNQESTSNNAEFTATVQPAGR
jgi:hypothetical protein